MYILGGEGAVAAEVEAAVRGIPNVADVERVWGTNRELTALKIYEKGIDSWGDTAILATGYSFADALSISPYAYASKTPILLGKKNGSLSKEVKELFASSAFAKVLIIGGTGVVSEETEDYLRNELGLQVVRLEGKTRYETSADIMRWELGQKTEAAFQPSVTMTIEGMGVATGANFPDALGAVSLLGKTHSPLLLVSDSNRANREILKANIEELIKPNVKTMKKGFIFGGTGIVSTDIQDQLNQAVE